MRHVRTTAFLAIVAASALTIAIATGVAHTSGASTASAARAATAAERLASHPHAQTLRLANAVRPAVAGDSGQWAGYVATPTRSTGAFRFVRATFTVPSVNCAVTQGATSDLDPVASHWVGLDGVGFNHGPSNSLEQAGVTTGCTGPTHSTPFYYAFWAMLPQTVTRVFDVNPGDAITTSVYHDIFNDAHHGQYNLVLTDVTSRRSFNVWESCTAPSCANSSAEVISETAAGGGGEIAPLADYGIANYEGIGITDKSGDKAGFSAPYWKYFMTIEYGDLSNQAIATPTSLYGGRAFSIVWSGSQ